MKVQTTKKAVKNSYRKIVCVGYCDLVHLLSFKDAFAYTAGVYGWNADIYDLDGTALVTGYRPFGDVSPSLELTRKYEQKAKEVINTIYRYDDSKKAMDSLIHDFLKEIGVEI